MRRAACVVVTAATLVAVSGCAVPETESETARETKTSALGQPNGDFPGYEERVVLYATNKARMDPSAEGWASFAAQAPLQWNYDLNRSARAHSTDMRDTPCFQHDSCDGTDTFARIKTFYTASWNNMGENIAAGVPDAATVVYNWINEIGAAAGETGHRESIFSASFNLMGTGYAAGGTKYKGYWTQDFVGMSNAGTRPRMTDGIHIRASGTGGNLTFGATYYDASSSAAAVTVNVVIDGTCTALSLVRGPATRGAYEKAITLADGCHGYYFVASNGTTTATYPDSGGLQVGVGSAASSCALFTTSVTAGSCGAPGTGGSSGGAAGAGGSSGAAGTGGSGAGRGGSNGAAGGTGRGGNVGSTGVAGNSGPAGSNGAAGSGTGVAGSGSGLAGSNGAAGSTGGGGHEDDGGGGCAVGAPSRGGSGLGLLAMLGLTLALRRQRRNCP